MTQVNFYTLSSTDPNARLLFVCRLTEKARELGHQVFIKTPTPAESKLLDDLLWQFKPASFIPHELVQAGKLASKSGNCPVQISTQDAPEDFTDVLINLTDKSCDLHREYARINEVIAADQESILAGRERYRAYRHAGAILETFKIE